MPPAAELLNYWTIRKAAHALSRIFFQTGILIISLISPKAKFFTFMRKKRRERAVHGRACAAKNQLYYYIHLSCTPGLLCLLDDGLHGVDVRVDLAQLLHVRHLFLKGGFNDRSI